MSRLEVEEVSSPESQFHPTVKGVAYARAGIGGLYRLNSDDSWTPLEDWANDSDWYGTPFFKKAMAANHP